MHKKSKNQCCTSTQVATWVYSTGMGNCYWRTDQSDLRQYQSLLSVPVPGTSPEMISSMYILVQTPCLMHRCVCIQTTFSKPLYIRHSTCIHRDPWKSCIYIYAYFLYLSQYQGYTCHTTKVKISLGPSLMPMHSRCKQGITNTLALPIDKMLYIYLLCPHTLNTKTICSNLNSLNTFTKEAGSPNVKLIFNKVKLPKVGSNVIVPVPNKQNSPYQDQFGKVSFHTWC